MLKAAGRRPGLVEPFEAGHRPGSLQQLSLVPLSVKSLLVLRDSASLTQIKGLQKALSQVMCSDALNPLLTTQLSSVELY